MIPPSTLRDAQALIESQGLRFESDLEDLVSLYDSGRMIGCGARSGCVLKMLALDPDHQGTSALGDLVTQLTLSGLKAGHDTLFIYTSPQSAASFQALGFRLLATHGPAALLEHGPGLEAYLARHAHLVAPGRNGAVVVNGNPFSLGHLHLVRTAAAQVDRLYVFVVREDRSLFPFEARFRLAREATANLPNVTVLDTGRYAVSAATFPSYFLRRLDEAAEAQMGLDLRLFAQRIAPAFHVVTRFAGEEPLCATTAAYNRVMAEVLPEHGLRWVEVPRLEASGGPISATRIRRAFASNDVDTLRLLVPPTTLDFLLSPKAQPLAARLRSRSEGTP